MDYKTYKIKVYGKKSIIYPEETYNPKSINQARTMFNTMKKLDPYIGKRIEVVEYGFEHDMLCSSKTIFENN